MSTTEQDPDRFGISPNVTKQLEEESRQAAPEIYVETIINEARGTANQPGTQPELALWWRSFPYKTQPEDLSYLFGGCLLLKAMTLEAQRRSIELAQITRDQLGIKSTWVIGGNRIALPYAQQLQRKFELATVGPLFQSIFELSLEKFALGFWEFTRNEASKLAEMGGALGGDLVRQFVQGRYITGYLTLTREVGVLRFRTSPSSQSSSS